MKNLHLYVLALALTVVGASLCAYKVNRLGIPLSPTEQTEVWTVEATLKFRGRGRSAKVELTTPAQPPGFSVLDEDYISSSFGLATESAEQNNRALWAAREVRGNQTLYYRLVVTEDREENRKRTTPKPDYPAVPDYPEPERSAVFSLLADVRSESADISSFTRELLQRFNDPTPDEDVSLLRESSTDELERVREIRHILAGARIPTRIIYVLKMEDRLREGGLIPWLEVFDDEEWIAFNPKTGGRGIPADVLVWQVGDEPLVSVKGANPADVTFSIARSSREILNVAQQRARLIDSSVLEFSLFSLPIATQNVYRILLTVPLGAFVVVLLRNFIGLKTFGTFMPILIALAFRETKLLWGIILFSTLVAIGVLLRFYLERLKLLLVPRLASVLIIVILLMAGVSVLSLKLGFQSGLSIALFPMVILAMTIERMSLTWDESGAREALTAGLGSLFVASLGYLVMNNEWVGYLVFVFPELLLVLLAITLLMGRYTGYRLSELRRFRSAVPLGGSK